MGFENNKVGYTELRKLLRPFSLIFLVGGINSNARSQSCGAEKPACTGELQVLIKDSSLDGLITPWVVQSLSHPGTGALMPGIFLKPR